MEIVELFTKAGPYGLAAVMVYMWRLERAERLDSQQEAKALRDLMLQKTEEMSERLLAHTSTISRRGS